VVLGVKIRIIHDHAFIINLLFTVHDKHTTTNISLLYVPFKYMVVFLEKGITTI
jgi:hypothetical protein